MISVIIISVELKKKTPYKSYKKCHLDLFFKSYWNSLLFQFFYLFISKSRFNEIIIYIGGKNIKWKLFIDNRFNVRGYKISFIKLIEILLKWKRINAFKSLLVWCSYKQPKPCKNVNKLNQPILIKFGNFVDNTR